MQEELRKRMHADKMMDPQELMRERQQYLSIQESTKKVSLAHINFSIVAHSHTQNKDPQKSRKEQSDNHLRRHRLRQNHSSAKVFAGES
jgi:hypothetical protein